VLDEYWELCTRAAAASLGGDVVGTDKISMASKSTEGTGEVASVRLRHALAAAGAGRGRTTFVHHSELYSRLLCFAAENLNEMCTTPLAQPEILDTARIAFSDAPKIADQQCANPLLGGELNDLSSGLVMPLIDAAAMTGLDTALLVSVPPPASRTALPRLRRTAGSFRAPGLLVAHV
jgi:hypothetical protein